MPSIGLHSRPRGRSTTCHGVTEVDEDLALRGSRREGESVSGNPTGGEDCTILMYIYSILLDFCIYLGLYI